MTNPRGTTGAGRRPLRERPAGWPVGSFDSYADAQEAVDNLSDREFPVDKLVIVGVDLMEVESVTGRLTWGRVLAGGAASGAWMGIFFGLLFGLFTPNAFFLPILAGIVVGAIFGMVLAAVPYGMSQGARDFTSQTQIVAGRYDILCDPQLAPQARDAIAGMNLGHRGRAGLPQTPAPAATAGPTEPAAPQTPAPGAQNTGGWAGESDTTARPVHDDAPIDDVPRDDVPRTGAVGGETVRGDASIDDVARDDAVGGGTLGDDTVGGDPEAGRRD